MKAFTAFLRDDLLMDLPDENTSQKQSPLRVYPKVRYHPAQERTH